ncbi:MAG TPA: protein phosphatase 2C domain-containing protein [Kofleriaceae bacterium]|nr:protein phosphatase 2C domain-containing protein [Kofleriaceae bacterium]
MTVTSVPALAAHGVTHAGHVRRKNEDCYLVDEELGLYLVLDGMGGHNAGDVASTMARDVIRSEVRAQRGRKQPSPLLEAAVRAASAAVWGEARRNRELHGMGTTVVGVMLAGEGRAVVAHVGDSRAYVLRGGRLRLVTRDHTVVAELLARGALSSSEAAVHPYKSVLSRNLGGRSDARVDLTDVELEPGDRILLCSDGLSGFASHEAMEQVLAGAEDAERAAAELVELALRGGGGDNVTALVLEWGGEPARASTGALRERAAAAWWERRALFAADARRRGVHESPICAVLSPDEAIAIVAGNLCEAIYHDLEQAAGLHVWTYAENLANGWLDQGGACAALRDLLDRLREAALAVVADVAGGDEPAAVALETGLLRALIVAEMAVAGAIGERMRRLEQVLVTAHTRQTTAPPFSDEKTVELSGVHKVEPPSPMVVACLERAWEECRAAGQVDAAAPQLAGVVEAAHRAALETSPQLDLAAPVADLFGTRVMGEGALRPLLESLDRGRARHVDAVRGLSEAPSIRAAALRRLAGVHEGLMSALAMLVVDAAQEVSDRYQRATEATARLRADVARHEARITKLERDLAGATSPDVGLTTVPDGRPELAGDEGDA